MNKAVATLLAWCAFSLLGTGMAQANLLTNGSFENGYTGSAGGNFVSLYSNNASYTAIPGWTVVNPPSADGSLYSSVDWINTYWKASEGTKSLDLAGDYRHGLIRSELFATDPGQTYRVTFDIAGNPDKLYTKALVAVSTGDTSELASHIFSFDQVTEQTTYTKENMGWQTVSFDFVAGSDFAQLYFGDITNPLGLEDPLASNEAWGAALDNVRVDPVPEPSTILLLGAGLAGLVVRRRRSRS